MTLLDFFFLKKSPLFSHLFINFTNVMHLINRKKKKKKKKTAFSDVTPATCWRTNKLQSLLRQPQSNLARGYTMPSAKFVTQTAKLVLTAHQTPDQTKSNQKVKSVLRFTAWKVNPWMNMMQLVKHWHLLLQAVRLHLWAGWGTPQYSLW